MSGPKYTTHDVYEAFIAPKPKKTVFGNYRIDADQLIYRAQTSVDAPSWTADPVEARKKIGDLIRDYDGKLVDDEGRAVMLEALTNESKPGILRVQYFETNLIAQKTNGTVICNSDTLELVGRTVSYGNVSENQDETDIQREFRYRGHMCLPLDAFQEANFGTFKIVERGETVAASGKHLIGSNWKISFNPVLFQLGGETYLYDIDRREHRYGKLCAFLTKLPRTCNSILDAYNAMKPEAVLKAEDNGDAVKRLGKWFFVPTKAPKLPEITVDEKLKLLVSNTYLDGESITYLTGLEPGDKQTCEPISAKIPKTRSMGDKTKCVGLMLTGRFFCKGKVTADGHTSMELPADQW